MNTGTEFTNTDCVVIISSCDAYSDLWRPFFNLFFKYWEDCPFEVVLCANFKTFDDSRVKTFLIGEDLGWAQGMIKMLNSVDAPNVLLLLEDFFIEKKVDTTAVVKYVNWVKENNAKILRLCTIPGPELPSHHDEIGIIPVGANYRISTQAAIWNKDCLLSLIKPEESIWQFELIGSKRSNTVYKDGFYGVWETALKYHHVVERGIWFYQDAKKYGAMSIGCDFQHRRAMTRLQSMVWFVRNRLVLLFEFIFDDSARKKIINAYHFIRRK